MTTSRRATWIEMSWSEPAPATWRRSRIWWTTSAEHDWSIQGHRFSPYGLIPYDPRFADEIEVSINDYLEEMQP